MPEQRVLEAVRKQKASSKQGFLQHLFAVWFDAFVYNQIWEDPRVDLEALELDSSSRILTISSGGCNALNYLLQDPASVTAVDLNRNHIFLLRLKLAAAQHLPDHERFFAFFGYGRSKCAESDYLRYIRPHLDPDTREFWESNTFLGSILYGSRIGFFRNAGLYDHSRNGYFLRLFHWIAKLSGLKIDSLLEATSVSEQRRIFETQIDPFFDNSLVALLGKMPVTAFGLGIPPQQFDELMADPGDSASVIDIYRGRVRHLACDFPIRDNYFAWQAFARRYDTRDRIAVPEYLKEENFAALRSNAGRLRTRIGSATDEIMQNDRGAFDRFVFLDAQDWMDEQELSSLWSAIADKALPSSRIIFRTAGTTSPVETKLPADLRGLFKYEEDTSRRLFALDRSSIYGGFHLYVLR